MLFVFRLAYSDHYSGTARVGCVSVIAQLGCAEVRVYTTEPKTGFRGRSDAKDELFMTQGRP